VGCCSARYTRLHCWCRRRWRRTRSRYISSVRAADAGELVEFVLVDRFGVDEVGRPAGRPI
jgi:hypothetical protein